MYLHNNPKKFDDERFFFRDSDRKFATFEIRDGTSTLFVLMLLLLYFDPK